MKIRFYVDLHPGVDPQKYSLCAWISEEIAKRDARIESLTAAGAEYQRQCFEQAAEISRLKGVIAKCKTAFVDINNEAKCFMAYENARNNFSEDSYEAKAYSKAAIKASESTKEALSAIKEMEHD